MAGKELERGVSEAYSINKLGAHPEILEDMRQGGPGRLVTVHLMPQNLCNQGCSFCSYRLPDNKNSSVFNDREHIPIERLGLLLDDLEALGAQGIEVTGGGEPLLYPYTEELWTQLAHRPFRSALVTNGTCLRWFAPLVSESLSWARVSIDAGTAETYSLMRKCPERHFGLAWDAVSRLREAAPKDSSYRLGVGFVLSNENTGDVYEFVKRASESGADNTRLSVVFSDLNYAFYNDKDALRRAVHESVRAETDFSRDGFKVHNLIPQRYEQNLEPVQDYRRCATKDLLCVVEGGCNVYTCCTFTGSLSGLYGNFAEHPGGFLGLWQEHADWRRGFDASKYCRCACLYRDRNLAMIDLIEGRHNPPPDQEWIHKEFI